MNIEQRSSLLVIPTEEWNELLKGQKEILRLFQELAGSESRVGIKSPYITAKEFMAAVRICRSNFDKLVNGAKIMTLKKGRKVYVVATEVDRYFKEVAV